MNRCKAKAPRFLSEWMDSDWLKSIMHTRKEIERQVGLYTYACILCDDQLIWLNHGNSLPCSSGSDVQLLHVDNSNKHHPIHGPTVCTAPYWSGIVARVHYSHRLLSGRNKRRKWVKRKPFRMIYLSRGKHQRCSMIYFPWWELCVYDNGNGSECSRTLLPVNWMCGMRQMFKPFKRQVKLIRHSFVAVTVRLFVHIVNYFGVSVLFLKLILMIMN